MKKKKRIRPEDNNKEIFDAYDKVLDDYNDNKTVLDRMIKNCEILHKKLLPIEER
jgi:ribosomal protein S17E